MCRRSVENINPEGHSKTLKIKFWEVQGPPGRHLAGPGHSEAILSKEICFACPFLEPIFATKSFPGSFSAVNRHELLGPRLASHFLHFHHFPCASREIVKLVRRTKMPCKGPFNVVQKPPGLSGLPKETSLRTASYEPLGFLGDP